MCVCVWRGVWSQGFGTVGSFLLSSLASPLSSSSVYLCAGARWKERPGVKWVSGAERGTGPSQGAFLCFLQIREWFWLDSGWQPTPFHVVPWLGPSACVHFTPPFVSFAVSFFNLLSFCSLSWSEFHSCRLFPLSSHPISCLPSVFTPFSCQSCLSVLIAGCSRPPLSSGPRYWCLNPHKRLLSWAPGQPG